MTQKKMISYKVEKYVDINEVTLVDFVAHCQRMIATHGQSCTFNLNAGSLDICAWREETDDEYAARVQFDKEREAWKEARERETYERLKAKFEG